MRASRLVPFALVLAAGCGGASSPPPSSQPDLSFSSPPPDLTFITNRPDLAACGHGGFAGPAGQNVTYRIQPGGSVPDVMVGKDVAYIITANVGGSYRLVWTGPANSHTFYGWVFTPGTFTGRVPSCNGGFCPLGNFDCVTDATPTNGGQRIDFSGTATGQLAGFDFVVSTEPVSFSIVIDGAPKPNQVFFPAADLGGMVANAGDIPFALTTQ